MSDNSFESPILDHLSSKMRCGIFTNAQGEILIIHDRKITSTVDYIEYDPQEKSFSLIYDDGKMQELGVEFNEKIKDNLLHGSEVTLARMKNKKIISSQKILFLIRAL